MNREEMTQLLIKKLDYAIASHGRPNTFTVRELVFEYGYPSLEWAYQLGREQALAGRLIDYKRGKFICYAGGPDCCIASREHGRDCPEHPTPEGAQ